MKLKVQGMEVRQDLLYSRLHVSFSKNCCKGAVAHWIFQSYILNSVSAIYEPILDSLNFQKKILILRPFKLDL